MYSVVLMAAVLAGGESPDFGRRGGCHGCWGGCYGGCYGGGWGGCRGGCYGGGCCGGYGGCYGGGWGCCGGGYSYGCGGGWGCCGGVVYSGYGCCGGAVIGGPVYGGGGGGKTIEGDQGTKGKGTKGKGTKGGEQTEDQDVTGGPAPLTAEEQGWLKQMMAAEKDAAKRKKLEAEFKKDSHVGRKARYNAFKKAGEDEDEVSLMNSAHVVVTVPAGARLTVDGQLTGLTSTVRTFETPSLTPGKVYAYDFEARFVRNGKPVTISRHVQVEAGKTIRLDMTRETVSVASK
jgi:uncharacterized protein (TIGR03000 family)